MDPHPNPNAGSSSTSNPVMGSSPASNPGVGSSDPSRYSLRVQMGTKREVEPVFGCRITPTARLINPNAITEVPPEHKFNFKWYRKYELNANKDNIRCSVHPDKVATLVCVECVKLKLPAKGSYHCTAVCYRDKWQNHRKLHLSAKVASPNNQPADKDEIYSWPQYNDGLRCALQELDHWVEMCSSMSYTPTEEDLGSRLMLVTTAVDSNNQVLCPNNTIETVPVRYAQGQKPRCILECQQKSGDSHIRSKLQAHSSGGVKISVLSYNVLADIYAHDGQYSELPAKWSLTWEYRQQNLLDEIIEYDADILCLQEVLSTHLEKFFTPELEKLGYSGVYKKKSGDIYTSYGHCMDGCAIFYRRDAFKEIVKYERAFDSSILRVIGELQPIVREGKDAAFQRLKQHESDSSLRRVLEAFEALQPQERDEAFQRLKKPNVALVVILEKLESEGTCEGIQPRICVANTHIYSDPWFPDVKLFQVVDLITGLDKIAETKIPMLVCGDFNSVPLSAPHQFITTRKLGKLPDYDPYRISQHLKPDHSLPLKSAYASFYNSDGVEEKQCRKFCSESGEPMFTHSTKRFQGTLDYIFYTEDSLILDGVLELLDHDDLGAGIPSPSWSSDHIALMGRFILNPTVLQQGSCAVLPKDLW
ncbi:hypothetical protein ACLB2K_046151 [Fragaria x ananassa]